VGGGVLPRRPLFVPLVKREDSVDVSANANRYLLLNLTTSSCLLNPLRMDFYFGKTERPHLRHVSPAFVRTSVRVTRRLKVSSPRPPECLFFSIQRHGMKEEDEREGEVYSRVEPELRRRNYSCNEQKIIKIIRII